MFTKKIFALLLTIFTLIVTYSIFTTSNNNKIVAQQEKLQNKVKACFVILIRNNELAGIMSTISQIEEKFNKNYHYDYVFLNNELFSDHFKQSIALVTQATVKYGLVNASMWGYPSFINQTLAAEKRLELEQQGVPYALSESYRHMCRFQSGYFFKHPLLDEYEYYWRLEPYVDYYCKIDYDVFRFMKDNKKKYGFNIAYTEHMESVPSLWDTVLAFQRDHPKLTNSLPKDNLIRFVTNDNGKTYNTCHFWSNFEIGDLSLWRSKEYLSLFDYLDKSGGFYYERWGDAPVHSIAASLLLKRDEFHFFNDIGYRHTTLTHCPTEQKYRSKCTCDPSVNFDFDLEQSCYPNYLDALVD